MIFIQSTKNGGISDSEQAMLRACHLSGQMEADQAVEHYERGELVPDTLQDRIVDKLDEDDWDAVVCLVVFIILVVAGSVLVHWLY